ncbi:lysophospholipid acyltransferase 5-like [Penaeus indicus]|uniref:lysophospholipid acyltransferase 5-like n=1 Tax=Penaeus indicus TaxID=29960 RepID=UPI00300D84D1
MPWRPLTGGAISVFNPFAPVITVRSKKKIFWCLYYFIHCVNIFPFQGQNVIHSAVCVLAAWLLLVVMGGTIKSVIISFLFQMTYLLMGYYFTGTDTYDIKWSMPHCVLTLRLIALTYDVYDGTKDPEKLSNDQKKTALSIRPSLLEVAAHTYFPASFMVGPQFSMRRYLDFVSGTLLGSARPPCLLPGLLRGGLGLIYLAVYQVGISYLPDSYINSSEYNDSSIWRRHIVVGIWAKITLYKYISCWLIAEGVCIMSGKLSLIALFYTSEMCDTLFHICIPLAVKKMVTIFMCGL